MHTKTMEGLIGARTNIELLNTPFRVFKEARREGDLAKMEQAMGYMEDFSDEAYEYKAKADEGMKKDVEETRRIAEEQREEAIKKRREEREELEKRLEEEREGKNNTDTVEISEEGKVLLQESTDPDTTVCTETKPEKQDAEREPVIYTKTGESVLAEQSADLKVSFSESV